MINFFYETNFKIENPKAWEKWIAESIINEGKTIGEVNYIFCDDEYLLDINIKYLQHDYYTDVIGFQYSEDEAELSGDIFISIDRVKENASNNNVPLKNELARVMIHGILHFAGYKDDDNEEKSKMTQAENLHLNEFKILYN